MGAREGLIAVGIFGFLATLLGGSRSSEGGGSVAGDDPPSNAGLLRLEQICRAAEIGPDWSNFLAFVAYGESRWNNLVGLGDPSLFPAGTRPNMKASSKAQRNEATAARKAFERNASLFVGCGHPPRDYQFGSGGWFGVLPANGIAQFRGTSLICLPPRSVFDPVASVCMALGMASRLQGWSGFQRLETWLNLRIGWGAPSKMGDAAWLAGRRSKYETHARALGLPASWVDERPPPLTMSPSQLAALHGRLQSAV